MEDDDPHLHKSQIFIHVLGMILKINLYIYIYSLCNDFKHLHLNSVSGHVKALLEKQLLHGRQYLVK